MKRIIPMLILMSLSLAGMAQDKTTRQERIDQWKNDMKEFQRRSAPERDAQAAVDTLIWRQAGAAVNSRSFVLEAESITFRDGTRIYVNSTTNFISVKGDRGVVQISPSSFIAGPNGVGGVTVDGTVCDMSVSSDKKGVVHVHMNISGVGISAQVDISLYPGSNDAYAVISPNFNSQTIRLEGRLVPYDLSRTYEGMSL